MQSVIDAHSYLYLIFIFEPNAMHIVVFKIYTLRFGQAISAISIAMFQFRIEMKSVPRAHSFEQFKTTERLHSAQRGQR